MTIFNVKYTEYAENILGISILICLYKIQEAIGLLNIV